MRTTKELMSSSSEGQTLRKKEKLNSLGQSQGSLQGKSVKHCQLDSLRQHPCDLWMCERAEVKQDPKCELFCLCLH